jgi:hypothetical protein
MKVFLQKVAYEKILGDPVIEGFGPMSTPAENSFFTSLKVK